MAADKGKKKGEKGNTKKGKPEPRNWSKIGFQLFILLILVMAILGFSLNYRGSNSSSNTGTSSTDKNFKVTALTTGVANASGVSVTTNYKTTLMDGLRLIPANASNVRFVDLKNDSVLAAAANSYFWLYGTLPPEKIYDAKPQRDLFALYPAGYFGDFTDQFVSLTDFGTARINQSYPDFYDIMGIMAKQVNSMYYYTGGTKPVVSGRIENVAPVIKVMYGSNASAYGDYSDLFGEIKDKHLAMNATTLEVVGRSCNLSYSDKYYAAVGPIDPANKSVNRSYYYVAVMHLNQTMPEADLQNLALLEGAMEKMGFKSYRTQFYGDYIIIEAEGSLDTCVDDMLNRWGYIKFQRSL